MAVDSQRVGRISLRNGHTLKVKAETAETIRNEWQKNQMIGNEVKGICVITGMEMVGQSMNATQIYVDWQDIVSIEVPVKP
jgi:hypothetical protein